MGSSRLPALVIKLTHTHLAFYHTEHQDAGPLDFQVSFGVILKALSKWKFTGSILASMKCSGNIAVHFYIFSGAKDAISHL